jgi:hypothetical protein
MPTQKQIKEMLISSRKAMDTAGLGIWVLDYDTEWFCAGTGGITNTPYNQSLYINTPLPLVILGPRIVGIDDEHWAGLDINGKFIQSQYHYDSQWRRGNCNICWRDG